MAAFGKLAPKHDPRTFSLKKYLGEAPALTPPPPAFDVIPRVQAGAKIGGAKRTSIGTLFPMDGNDTRGDCVLAGIAHGQTIVAGMVQKRHVPSATNIISLYNRLTGNRDTGLVMLDTLNYWRKNGITKEKCLAFAAIDWKDTTILKQAMTLFGGVFLGFRVQEGALDAFNRHQEWEPGPLTTEGHAVWLTGYDASSVTCLTWGSTQKGTWDWLMETGDECWAVIPTEAKNPGFAHGLNLDALNADLAALSAVKVG